MLWLGLCIGALAALLVYAIRIRHGLLRLRDQVRRTWLAIDALLLERHDELAKLIEQLQEQPPRSRELIGRLARARSAVFAAQSREDRIALATAEGQLRAVLASLLSDICASSQPGADDARLTSGSNIRQLDRAIAETSERYNADASLLNIRLQLWPDRLVARLCGLDLVDLIEFRDQGTG